MESFRGTPSSELEVGFKPINSRKRNTLISGVSEEIVSFFIYPIVTSVEPTGTAICLEDPHCTEQLPRHQP